MCGIAGIVALRGFDPNRLVTMTQMIAYRGPDGFGFSFFPQESCARGEVFHDRVHLPSFDHPKLGFGHRRLSILDLSTSGSQPMQTEDGALSITFNGEIYNYLEIRRELQRLGHRFKSQTDTEVILRSYRQWGTDCLRRFNGMWAFALWDAPKQTLICSRDRFGVKPFYYYIGTDAFVFGSEIKQLLEYPGIRREANEAVVHAFLDHGVKDHSSETFFKDIFQLPGGSVLSLDLERGSIAPKIERYWELPVRPIKIEDGEACSEFLARFTKAVTLRLRSDVAVGSCLSGGLDSSSIVCVARQAVPNEEFHTFSSCSEDAAHDERSYMLEVVRTANVQPHLVFPQPRDLWASFERLMWHQDEPFGDTSVFAQWSVMRQARQAGIPVLLDGQGADETLCGYLKFYYFYLWHLLKRADPRFVVEAFCRTRNDHTFLSAWTGAQRYLPSFFHNSTSPIERVCRAEYYREHGNGVVKLGPDRSVAQRQKTDLLHYSVPALFHYEDRNSMAHSIESREPFLDYELVEFLVNLPVSLKLRHGWTKWILRQSLKGILPEKVRLRRDKMWFPSPQKEWLKQGANREVRRVFSESDLHLSAILERNKVIAEFDRFAAGSADCLTDSFLFRVLSLETWARCFDVN